MVESSGERYIEARCEQVWMVVDSASCRPRWLSFADQIGDVTVYEHSRRVTWNTQDHPRLANTACGDCLTVELFPEGAGTRVRLMASREATGPINQIVLRIAGQRTLERDIRRSLDLLAQMLTGHPTG